MKNFKTKLAKIILPTLLLSFVGNCYSQTSPYSLSVNELDKNEEKKITHQITTNLNNILAKQGTIIPKLNIQVNIDKKYQTHSYTDAKNLVCNININYHDKNPALLTNFDDDLIFTLWHEIGHCILGKAIILNEEIKWHPDILEKTEIVKDIHHLSRVSFSTAKCPTDTKCSQPTYQLAPPMIVYHEMFADMYAIMWWINSNKNPSEILTLSKNRFNHFNQNTISSTYATNFAIPFALDDFREMKKEPSIVVAEKNAQKGLIAYIAYLRKEYPKLFTINGSENE